MKNSQHDLGSGYGALQSMDSCLLSLCRFFSLWIVSLCIYDYNFWLLLSQEKVLGHGNTVKSWKVYDYWKS